MIIYVDEKDIEFCSNAIKLIKENGATDIKKDKSDVDGSSIVVYPNAEGKIIIGFGKMDILNSETIEKEENDKTDILKYKRPTGKNHSFVRTAKGIVRSDIDFMNMTDNEKHHMMENDHRIFENSEEFNGNHLVEYAFINPDDGKECCLGYITKDMRVFEGTELF